tara:strand:+ start:114 stop:344 length:231 start_codon:yes stop_codon:yes gene_type:complete
VTAQVTLLDLEPDSCRWPVNDGDPYLFCAAPRVAGSSYCACHAARAVGPGTPSERNAGRTLRWVTGSETSLTNTVE